MLNTFLLVSTLVLLSGLNVMSTIFIGLCRFLQHQKKLSAGQITTAITDVTPVLAPFIFAAILLPISEPFSKRPPFESVIRYAITSILIAAAVTFVFGYTIYAENSSERSLGMLLILIILTYIVLFYRLLMRVWTKIK